VAGMVYAFKIANAAAEQMKNLEDVTRITKKTADACHSVGAALRLPAPFLKRVNLLFKFNELT